MAEHTFVLSLGDEAGLDAKGFEVSALKDCPHLSCLRQPEGEFAQTLSCAECGDSSEPWVCLTCFSIGCSRYIQSHGAAHALSTGATHDAALPLSHAEVTQGQGASQGSGSNAAAGGAVPQASPSTADAHAIALSYADMSIWCYCCEAYLDVFSIRPLHAPFGALYRARFGEEPQLPS